MKSFKQLKKAILTVAFACLLAVSAAALAGCGGSSDSSTSGTATSNAGSSSSSDEITLKDLESSMSEAYMGVTDAGEGFYYAASSDGSLCIVMAADTDGNTVSFVGPATASGDMVTVTDIANGSSLTFQVVPQTDGTILLDMGSTGSALVAPCNVSDVLSVMQTLDTYGNALA